MMLFLSGVVFVCCNEEEEIMSLILLNGATQCLNKGLKDARMVL